MEYKKTLNLPKTGFPMKAGLVTREPERLQKWQDGQVRFGLSILSPLLRQVSSH